MTTRTFQDMLNEYLTYDMLKEELLMRHWLLSNIDIDDGWKGGTLPVPFKGGQASSLKFGGLTAEGDIAEDIRPNVLVAEIDVLDCDRVVVRDRRWGDSWRNDRLHVGDLKQPSRNFKTAPELLKRRREWRDHLKAGQRRQHKQGQHHAGHMPGVDERDGDRQHDPGRQIHEQVAERALQAADASHRHLQGG